MNFLKKKLKTVVHGKRNKDDDDDFDNYIPEVPPHPSLTATASSSSSGPHFASTSLFDAFNNTVTGAANSAIDFASNSLSFNLSGEGETKQSPEETKLTLEELKEREEEHKRIEKEKLKQQHEEKKDNADWQFFLSLTAKVDAVTSKTQSVLDKLKDDSAVKEIAALEEQEEFGEKVYAEHEAPKTAGGWIAFEENTEFNPSDQIFAQPKEEPKKEVEVTAENIEKTQKLHKQLLDDFGFGSEVESTQNTQVKDIQDDIDPFDTSSFDIEAIKAGKTPQTAPKSDNLLHDFDIQEVDPFDTSHIENAISSELTLKDVSFSLEIIA